MARIDLNFTMSYCARWGVREAVREVVQNARDVEIEGGSFRVEHDARKGLLTVTSEGQHVTSRALVFGATTKAEDARTIGQFGDGLKVALGVFLRHRCAVKVNTGREVWVPCVVERDGERLVGVTTRCLPTSAYRERVVFEVGGVTAADWEEWRRGFLFLCPPTDVVRTASGTIIRDADRRGAIFCKGILVERRDEQRYGYDLPDLKLNRDREVADGWEVEWAIRKAWAEATRSAASADSRRRLYTLLADPDQREVVAGQTTAAAFAGSAPAVAEQFRADHGRDAVPVGTSDEAVQAGQRGRKGVVVPPALLHVLRQAGVEDLAAVKSATREDAARRYAESDLSPRELDALQGALSVFAPAIEARGECVPAVEVVDFADPQRLGLYNPQGDRVLLSRACLAEPRTLYGVLAHEVAHRHGGDGDAAHRQAIEDLMGRAIASLVRW